MAGSSVVDVTFPNMADKVDTFAKSAAASFGLSETMAKQYTGTFGSMAEVFGFTEKQALAMGTTLTGLSGDVASFYNISQNEAYIKLKSVFTGETETLKDLGIVMASSNCTVHALLAFSSVCTHNGAFIFVSISRPITLESKQSKTAET